jgi:hypothetical protein
MLSPRELSVRWWADSTFFTVIEARRARPPISISLNLNLALCSGLHCVPRFQLVPDAVLGMVAVALAAGTSVALDDRRLDVLCVFSHQCGRGDGHCYLFSGLLSSMAGGWWLATPVGIAFSSLGRLQISCTACRLGLKTVHSLLPGRTFPFLTIPDLIGFSLHFGLIVWF